MGGERVLEQALQYAGRSWPVFPLSASKVPLKGTHGHLDASTDPAALQALWQGRPRANVGLATGRIVVIDPDGRSALERLLAIGAAHGGWPMTLTAKTPRSIHLYYRAPEGVEIRSYNEPRATKGADGIDIKGAGGYVVLPPSRVKSNGQWVEYAWLLQHPIAELPQWAVEWINSLKGVREQKGNSLFATTLLPDYIQNKSRNSPPSQSVTRKASSGVGTEWSAREEERIRSALEAIPAEGYDQWVQVGMALSSLDWERSDGSSIAFDLFDEWSSTKPDLYSLDQTEKKWASFGRGRAGITLGTLYHIAEQHGWQGYAAPEAKDPFNPFGETPRVEHANGHVNGSLLEGLSSPNSESPLIRLSEHYSVIGDVGGKCLVMGWTASHADETVQVPSFQTFRSFAERYGHRYVAIEKKDKVESVQLGAQWLKWGRRPTYDRIDLLPGQPPVIPGPPSILNLWRGFSVNPARGSWERMKAHIAEVLANNDPLCLDYIMRWSAWAIQNPGERAEAALVFRGGKGSGKGTFAHAMRRLFGAHGLHIANSKHLVGSFNAHLRNCLLLYADEAFWAGDKQGESTLKALITEATLTIEQKGVDVVQWRNRIHLIMTANAQWVVPASHDERRYAMFNVSETHIGDKSYFDKLHTEMENGGLAAMLHDLQHAELGAWHPRFIPQTQALTEQKIQSMGLLQEWWGAVLNDARVPACEKGAADLAMAQYILHHIREFNHRLIDLTPARLGRFLSEQGCIKIHRASGNAWRFPTLAEAREKWARRYAGWQWEREAREWEARA